MLYLQKYLKHFENIFLAERWGRWLFWLIISSAQRFWVCKATLQLFQNLENVKISIFSFTLSQQKCYIFKSISQIFKSIPLAERWERWLLWLKISCAQIFWFCNRNVLKTFPKCRKCKNFNFLLYPFPTEMLYLQKYLTNFQKLFFGWKMRKLAIVVENFLCTDILVLQ